MNDDNNYPIIISIDIRKNRVRIHKSTYHLIGEPKYIQFLVNPEKRMFAFRGVDNKQSDGTTNIFNIERMNTNKSYDIYSQFFIKKLRELSPELSKNNSYHLSGKVFTSQKIAVFSLEKIQPIKDTGERNI